MSPKELLTGRRPHDLAYITIGFNERHFLLGVQKVYSLDHCLIKTQAQKMCTVSGYFACVH